MRMKVIAAFYAEKKETLNCGTSASSGLMLRVPDGRREKPVKGPMNENSAFKYVLPFVFFKIFEVVLQFGCSIEIPQ